MAKKVTFRATAFKNKAERLTAQLRKLIEGSIQETGLKEEDSQMVCLLNALQHLEHTITGVEDSDIICQTKSARSS